MPYWLRSIETAIQYPYWIFNVYYHTSQWSLFIYRCAVLFHTVPFWLRKGNNLNLTCGISLFHGGRYSVYVIQLQILTWAPPLYGLALPYITQQKCSGAATASTIFCFVEVSFPPVSAFSTVWRNLLACFTSRCSLSRSLQCAACKHRLQSDPSLSNSTRHEGHGPLNAAARIQRRLCLWHLRELLWKDVPEQAWVLRW